MDDAMRKNNSIVGHCLIILTQIILGLNIPITRDILLNYLTPLAYIAVRALITALLFWLVYCFQKQEKIESMISCSFSLADSWDLFSRSI